jgi:hypothetical protein
VAGALPQRRQVRTKSVSGVHGVSSGEVAFGPGTRQGWWLVADDGDGRVVAGPFADRAEAGWAAGPREDVRPVHGSRREDGSLARRPSPQEWAWLAHLGDQLDRLPGDWDAVVSDDDPLTTLVVEVTAALCEAGLPVHDGSAVGGVCLSPQPALGGIVVAWRQHDRVSVDQVHGAPAAAAVQQAMNRALAEVLAARGLHGDALAGGGLVVRPAGR